MQYDPIKRSLGKVFNQGPQMRILFYKMLNVLLLRSWHVRKELRIFAKNHSGKLQILDAGSGFGQYSWFLANLNPHWDITAVDVKQEQVDDCNAFFKKTKRNNTHFEVQDLTRFVKENHFDLIISVDVMEHILEDEMVFKNFYQSLRNNGLLLISTPSDQGGSDVHHHDEASFIDEHVRDGYNVADITEKLKRAGFQQVETRYTYGKPGSRAWKLSMKIPIKMLNISRLFFILLPFYYLLTFPFVLIMNYSDLKKHHETGTGLLVKAWK